MNKRTATEFGVIRHAPTLWNEQKRIQGQKDSPLTDQGCTLALAWGKQLHQFSWDHILTSDLGRARQTAELINRTLKLSIHPDSRLREQDWGTWAGITLNELQKRDDKLLQQQIREGWNFRPPGGETRKEVLTRSLSALNDAHATWPTGKILVVCHEGVIKCLLYHFLNREFLPDEPPVINKYNLHVFLVNDVPLSLTAMNHFALTAPDTGKELQ